MKWHRLFIVLPFILIVGCGTSQDESSSSSVDSTKEQTSGDKMEENTNEEGVPKEENNEKNEESSDNIGGSDEFEVERDELGTSQIYMKNRDVGIEDQIGPIIFKIDKVQTLRLQVSSDYRFLFDDKKEVTIVSFNVIVENTSDDTISFYPNQARLVTNTGEQVNADIVISEDVGGEFLGKVKKEGGVLFYVDSMPSELTEVRFVVEGPYNEQFTKIEEERYEYKIDVTK